MKNINFKDIAHAVKEWAIRFFNVYFLIFAILITYLVLSGKSYLFESIILICVLLFDTFLKIKLDKKTLFLNIGFKYAVCLIIFIITYFILCFMSGNLPSAIIFSLSVLSLFGIKETCLFCIEWINQLLASKRSINSEIKKEKTYLTKILSLDSVWNEDEFDNDEISKMLYEFINISNDNQMGHVVIRSMSNTNEGNLQKIYVKAKDGYHIILKGELNDITKKCSDVISNGKLVEINDETISSFSDKLNELNSLNVVFCAFKEIKDIQQEDENNYILAGCGVYETETVETIAKNDCKKIQPSKSNNIIENVFLVLISTILLTANIFASLFDAYVFNSCEIITSGMLCALFAVITSYCGYLPAIKSKSKCVIFTFAVLCVCISYFTGRYIMTNADYEHDLFHIITANIMTTASLVSYVMLVLLTTVIYNNWTSRIVSTICCFVLLCYMFIPPCCKLLQGYDISYIYISAAYLISLASVFISSILYFILRKKDDGTKISD